MAVLFCGAGCGRRGPPLPPVLVTPEPPRLLPLRQEDGRISIRWFAPRLAEDGSAGELQLREAIVLYRIVDIRRLAAEERASRRSPDREEAAGAEESPSGEEERPEASPETEPSPTAAQTPPEASPETEPSPTAAQTPPEASPETERSPAAAQIPATASAETEESGPPSPDDPASAEETATVGEPAAGPTTEQAASDQDSSEESRSGEEESPADDEAETGVVVLRYDELEFEVLAELRSEVAGEERLLEFPVDPEWVGRRLEVTIRYASRGGPSEESEARALDISDPLPTIEEVEVEIGERALTVRWLDPRPDLSAAPALADPIFEVFRRRGEDSDAVGRSLGPTLADREIVWGEEVCYRVRLLLAGDDDERVLPDPGQDSCRESPEDDRRAEAGASPRPAPPDAAGSDTPEETPVLVRVPPTGSTALSVGPLSSEHCVNPVDVFPPPAPSDLRVFWRPARTELSWKESLAEDLAGYHVYRSGAEGSDSERLTASPVGIAVFHDSERDPQTAYRYSVTAVDGADPANESLPSAPALATPRR